MELNDYILIVTSTIPVYYYYIISIIVAVLVIIVTFFVANTKNTSDKAIIIEEDKDYEDSDVTDEDEETENDDQEVYKKYFEDENFFDLANNTEGASKQDPNITKILGKIKAAKFKAVEETLSEEQIQAEKEIEKQQLETIYELLRKQEEKYNLGQMKEEDFKAQLGLYR